jgi:hypothetical protein
MTYKVLEELFKKYIKNSLQDEYIENEEMMLCRLTKATVKGCRLNYEKVFVTTRMLKHIYDKRPAEEFFCIINLMHKIIKYPDNVYKNKDAKRGDFGFVKKIKGESYFSSLELVDEDKKIYVATTFRLRKKNYLNSYNLLWNWRDGKPSS